MKGAEAQGRCIGSSSCYDNAAHTRRLKTMGIYYDFEKFKSKIKVLAGPCFSRVSNKGSFLASSRLCQL
jgi:hypothetical protein